MRVAVFTDADLDAMNGTTRTLRALISCAPPDLSPRIFSFAPLDVDAPSYFATSPTGFYLPGFQEFRRRLRDDDVRVIHTTSTGPAGIAARYLAFRMGLPLVGSVHASLANARSTASRWETALADQYRRWYLRGCQRVLLPSANGSRVIGDASVAARSVVWPRGVDSAVFSPSRRTSRIQDEWHVSSRRPAILVAGRISAEKRVDLIQPLSSWLYRRRIAHRFIFAGDGPMRADLATNCPDACFLGTVPHQNLPAVLASADVLLYPTDAHTGCTSLLEAQASGLPVIVSAASNAGEHMQPGITGYVCRAGDVREFGARLEQLLVDRDRRGEMGSAARRFAVTRTWPASLGPVYALYRSLVAVPADRRHPLATPRVKHENP